MHDRRARIATSIVCLALAVRKIKTTASENKMGRTREQRSPELDTKSSKVGNKRRKAAELENKRQFRFTRNKARLETNRRQMLGKKGAEIETSKIESSKGCKQELMSEHDQFTHAIFDAISRTKRALPYPARMSCSRSIAWIGKKVMTYHLKTPFFPIPANLTVLRRSVTRLKTRAG